MKHIQPERHQPEGGMAIAQHREIFTKCVQSKDRKMPPDASLSSEVRKYASVAGGVRRIS